MSYYANPETLAANPPESWRVERKVTNSRVRWYLYIEDGAPMFHSYGTKREALAERDNPKSQTRRDVEQERLWYEGVTPSGWRSYADCLART